MTIFNGGGHNLTLYVDKGGQKRGEPGPCDIPNGHEAINVNIVHATTGISEQFSVPLVLMHPARGEDATVIKAVANIAREQKVAKQNGVRRRIGLFETVSCPANHQRQAAVTFTREDGVVRTGTTLVACK